MNQLGAEVFDMGRRAEVLAETARGTEAQRLLAEASDLLLRAATAHHGGEPSELPAVEEQPTESSKLADQLRALGVRGVLVTAAQVGDITELRCAMPQCFCPDGPEHFEPRPPPVPPWAPSVDHYPILKKDGGQLVLGNVRLAHIFCNQEDYRINYQSD